MSEFFSFRKMITPTIIQVLFWVLLVVNFIVAIALIVNGATADYGGGGQVLYGLIWLFLGPLVVRIYCEILIVIFRMHSSLNSIDKNIAALAGVPYPAPAPAPMFVRPAPVFSQPAPTYETVAPPMPVAPPPVPPPVTDGPTARACGACGTVNAPGSNFCQECGIQLNA